MLLGSLCDNEDKSKSLKNLLKTDVLMDLSENLTIKSATIRKKLKVLLQHLYSMSWWGFPNHDHVESFIVLDVARENKTHPPNLI